MRAWFTLGLIAGLLAPLAVQASEAYQNALIQMDQTAQSFMVGAGYIEQSVDQLTDEHYYSNKIFPKLVESSAQIFHIDADLDALTRSILLLEAQEAELPHVRYQINYSSNTDTEVPELKHDYIEVTRYNLGPARRVDVLQYVDAEHVASPAEFGVGPHVSWRFVMAPIMGMQANVLYAARKEVADSAAQQAMCLTQPCLSLDAAELPSGQVQVLVPALLAPVVYRAENASAVARPARVMQELWAEFKSDDPLPYHRNIPQFTFVISMDVVGQESSSVGTGLQNMVLDDAIAKVWLQRVQAAGMESDLTQVTISRY